MSVARVRCAHVRCARAACACAMCAARVERAGGRQHARGVSVQCRNDGGVQAERLLVVLWLCVRVGRGSRRMMVRINVLCHGGVSRGRMCTCRFRG